MSEPMITIKKPDGTFAKVTLSEFKKMQAEKSLPPANQDASKPSNNISEEKVMSPVTPAKKHHIVHQTLDQNPVQIKSGAHSAVGSSQPKALTRTDASSPLEEKIPVNTSAPLLSSKREKQVEEVVRKIGFGVAPDLQGRLKSLILARLKDLKSEYELQEMLSRPVKNSGLGLTNSQVDKIIKSCQEVMHADSSGELDATAPALKGKPSGMALMVEPPELPMVIPVNNNLSVKNSTSALKPLASKDDNVVSKLINESMAAEPVFKISAKPSVKPMVQDVSAPPDLEMGPVEEFKSLTITEFRRLSSNPEEAAKRLHQKMFNLQEESFVWYLDAVAAYHSSPLYLEYMAAVSQSLAERKSLANVLAVKNGIKLNEVMAIIEMEKTL